jgi:hypothetical protein
LVLPEQQDLLVAMVVLEVHHQSHEVQLFCFKVVVVEQV